MMKHTENAFDKLMENYELDNIVTEKVVRSDGVKDSAFEQLGLGRKKKRWNKKRVFGMIAAAAAAAVIGTSVIAASPLGDVFKGYISGTDDITVYTGDNVQFASDKTNVDVKGVVCDDKSLFAVLEIKKKDGTSFTDDIHNAYILSYDKKYKESQDKLFVESGNKDYHFMISDDQQVFFKELAPNDSDTEEDYLDKMIFMNGRIEYDFQDKNTIKGFLEYDNHNYNQYDFQGKTIGLKEGKIYIYQRGECIYKYSNVNKNARYDSEIYQQQTQKVEENYQPLLAENQIIDYEPGTSSMYITTITEVDVDYEISFDINYTPNNLIIDVDSKQKFDIADARMYFEYIEITPFNATLKLQCVGDDNFAQITGNTLDYKNKVIYKYGGLDIVMKDGTNIRTDGLSVNGSYVDEQIRDLQEVELCYHGFCDNDYNFTAIDPQNIKAVYLAGVKIYGDGADTMPMPIRSTLK